VSSFRRVIAAVTLAHLVVGFWIATSTPGPLLSADDVAYLGLARTLVGQGDLPLPTQPPYGLLYPVLLAPGWLVGLDESAMLTFGRLVNATLGAAMIPALYLLVRRTTGADRPRALLAATVTASLPAALLHSSIIWTETLLALLVVLALLALDRFRARPSVASASIVVAAAMAQVATHPRTLPAALVVVGAGIWLSIRHRRFDLVVILAASSAVVYGLVEWARRAVHDAAFGSTGLYDAGDLVDTRGLSEVPDMIVLGLGSVAYLILATAGLVIIGGVALWRAGVVGRTSLAVLGATVAMAGWFLTGVPRADKWLHGRYVEAVAAPLVAVGIVRLTTLDWKRVVALGGAIVTAGVFAAWAGPGDNWAHPRSPVMMLGVEPGGAPFGADHFEPGAAAFVALLVLVLWWVLARRQIGAAALGMAVVLGIGAWSGIRTLDDLYASSVAAEAEAAVAGLERSGDDAKLAIDTSVPGSTWIAVAWRFGLDESEAGIIPPDAAYRLTAAEAPAPPGGEEVATLPGAVLYRLGG
jgi:hypothetical protein